MVAMIPAAEMAQIENTIISRKVRQMFGLDLLSWEQLMLWSLAGAALAAVFVVVATTAVLRLQKVEAADAKREFEAYKMDVGAKIAEANARAAEANEKAEEERLARVRLETKLAPRRLSGDDVNRMAAILSVASPMNVAIVSRMMDPEGEDFADDLAGVISKSHWNAVRYRNWTRSDKGVFIATAEGTPLLPGMGALIAALDVVNIAHTTIVIKGDDLHRVSPWFGPGVMYLLIGAKP